MPTPVRHLPWGAMHPAFAHRSRSASLSFMGTMMLRGNSKMVYNNAGWGQKRMFPTLSQRYFFLALALLISAAGCNQPGAPGSETLDVTGVWTGSLPLRMPDGDWSAARVALVQADGTVTGEVMSRDGVRHDLKGSIEEGEIVLSVQGLPGTSTCASIQLYITGVTVKNRVRHLSGRVGGRCYGTVAGSFELRKTSGRAELSN